MVLVLITCGIAVADEVGHVGKAAINSLIYSQWPFSFEDAKWRQEETARVLRIPIERQIDLGDNVIMQFVLIPAGRFIMGTPNPQKPFDSPGKEFAWLLLVAGMVLVLVLIVLVRAFSHRKKFQYGLGYLISIQLLLALALWAGVRWRNAENLHAEYKLAKERWRIVGERNQSDREVIIKRPFYMAKYEVTQQQFSKIMGFNPSNKIKNRENYPVDDLQWAQAEKFCLRLQTQYKEMFRVPTEEEWEYACRAGTPTLFHGGDAVSDLRLAGWFSANSGGKTHLVGQKQGNAFGLFDMHGNVFEWCAAIEGIGGETIALEQISKVQSRCQVLRGGCYKLNEDACWSSSRFVPAAVYSSLLGSKYWQGIRLVLCLNSSDKLVCGGSRNIEKLFP